jgi:hypothetical protein
VRRTAQVGASSTKPTGPCRRPKWGEQVVRTSQECGHDFEKTVSSGSHSDKPRRLDQVRRARRRLRWNHRSAHPERSS